MTGVMDISMGEGPDALTFKANLSGRWLGADCGDEANDETDSADNSDEQDGADR
jgi:hypothetical protein